MTMMMHIMKNGNGNMTESLFYNLFNRIPLHDFSQRFTILKYVRDNNLFTSATKNEIFELFARYQHELVVLNGVVRRKKYSKMKFAGEDCDFTGVPLSDISHNLKMTIVNCGIKYIFRISDLINIINKSLTYREELFLVIQPAKNPYTNIPFTKANLFNIYYHIRYNTRIVIPVLFHLFYTTSFDKNEFSNRYEAVVLDNSIQDYIDEFQEAHLVEIGHEWIKKFKHHKKQKYDALSIHKKYPIKNFLRLLRPILKLYLIHSHTLTSSMKYSSFTKACTLMVDMLENNADFGKQPNVQPKQVVFKSLRKLNTHSFSIKNEHHISVVENFLNNIPEFKYPNIKPFDDKIFIIRNYVNIATSNSIQNIRTGNRYRLLPPNDNAYPELYESTTIDFINRLNNSDISGNYHYNTNVPILPQATVEIDEVEIDEVEYDDDYDEECITSDSF